MELRELERQLRRRGNPRGSREPSHRPSRSQLPAFLQQRPAERGLIGSASLPAILSPSQPQQGVERSILLDATAVNPLYEGTRVVRGPLYERTREAVQEAVASAVAASQLAAAAAAVAGAAGAAAGAARAAAEEGRRGRERLYAR